MIIYNSKTINDLHFNTSDTAKVYWNNSVCFNKIIVPILPFEGKLKSTYSDGKTYELECNSYSALTTGETNPSDYAYSAMTTALIGGCALDIHPSAFYNCKSLSAVTMQDGVSTIQQGAFMYCNNLKTVSMPSTITNIGIYAFYNCSNLESIVIKASTPPTLQNTNALQYTNDCPIYVPNASVYKSASGWSTYASRIKTII